MKWAGIPSAIIALATLVGVALGAIGFETKEAHGRDVRRLESGLDTIRWQQASDRVQAVQQSIRIDGLESDIRRILCYNQAQAGERPFSDCVLERRP